MRLSKCLLSVFIAAVMLVTVIPTVSATNGESAVPVTQVTITTENGNGNTIVKDDGYVKATEIRIEDTEGNVISEKGEIKVRGNTTAKVDKKPFTFRFPKKVKKNLLGMGEARKWVLLANAFDPTLLRNYVAFDMAKQFNLAYTSGQEFVELTIDGEYRGCYTLMEPVEAGTNRVEINVDDTDDTEFMLELDRRTESGITYIESGLRFAITEPEEPTESQVARIQSVMDNINAAIISKDFDRISELIDIESFAKFGLLNELYKTVDFTFSSVNFYYKDGKLYAGPPWDYDLSTGNVNPEVAGNEPMVYPTGLRVKSNHYYKYLYQCPEFMAVVKQVYRENYAYISNIGADNGLIDTLADNNSALFERNYQKWDISNMYYLASGRVPDATYEENVSFLKNWLVDRNDWLSSEDGFDIFRTQKIMDTQLPIDSADDNIATFELGDNITFKNADLLGVQKKRGEPSFRFITVVSSELLEQATDYGYVMVATDKETATAKENAWKINLQNGHKFSCANSSNSLAGDYGSAEAQTNYKYITAAVNNLTSDKAIVARFYIKTAEGVHYAKYLNVYDGCAARIADFPAENTNNNNGE